MTIEEARALAAEFNERVKSIGSSETQHADIGRLLKASHALSELATTLADPALAKAAYDTEQARVKAEEAAKKQAEADAKKDADAKKAEDDAVRTAEPEPIELAIDREREAAKKKSAKK
jgi:hypothetical protein